jgi:hypothetical protein
MVLRCRNIFALLGPHRARDVGSPRAVRVVGVGPRSTSGGGPGAK